MRLPLLPFALLTNLVVAGCANRDNANSSTRLTVNTLTGSYTGVIDPEFPETRQFLSIPFAEPPVQARRWLPPQKLPQSKEHHNASKLPPSCPQFVSLVPSLLSTYFAEGALIDNGDQNHTSGLVGAATSEDCLYLAIWTPANATTNSKLPVLLFLPGGGFQTGGINSKYYNPTSWIERSQSHIVITVNYRVNIFGFPNAPGLAEQNIGILDQRMALEWMRENIAAFGGDPEAITQWGQSAGSMSSDIHAHAFPEDPIARAYFLMSGTAFSATGIADTNFSNFTFVAQHFGCESGGGNSSATILDCLRKVSFENITNFVGKYGDSGTTPAFSFLPVVDDRIIFSDYAARANAGKVARLPVILSNTANEASSLVPFPADDPSAGFPQEVILGIELAGFVCPTYSSTLERNNLSIPVYRYQYAGRFPNLNPLAWTGAWHGEDIPLVFGTYDLVKGVGEVPRLEVETSRAMQEHVLAFMKDPLRGPQRLGWQAVDARSTQNGTLIRFGTGGKAVEYVNSLEVDRVCQGLGDYDAFP
jgi:acetylcholinesterase